MFRCDSVSKLTTLNFRFLPCVFQKLFCQKLTAAYFWRVSVHALSCPAKLAHVYLLSQKKTSELSHLCPKSKLPLSREVPSQLTLLEGCEEASNWAKGLVHDHSLSVALVAARLINEAQCAPPV